MDDVLIKNKKLNRKRVNMNNQSHNIFEKNNSDFISLLKRIRVLSMCDQVENKSGIKNFQRLSCTLFVSIFLISLSSCTDYADVAIKTKDIQQGKFAVKQLTDQTILTKIALEAYDSHVASYAVEKITNHSILTQIAIESDSYRVCEAAVEKITDQSMLEKIVTEAKSDVSLKFAIEKLNNPILLVNFVVHDNFIVREAAVIKLINPTMMDSLTNIKDNKTVYIIHKFLREFDGIPLKRRKILIMGILPIFMVLNDKEVLDIVGEIVEIDINHSYTSRSYYGSLNGTMGGESISCKIKLMNFSKPLFGHWATEFPNTTTSLNFRNAPIKYGDFLEPVFERIPTSVLERFFVEEKFKIIKKDVGRRLSTIRNTKKK